MDRKCSKKEGRSCKKKSFKVGNVARLENKNRDFWKGLREWNVMFLSET